MFKMFILFSCAENWQWIPFYIEMIKSKRSVPKIQFGAFSSI